MTSGFRAELYLLSSHPFHTDHHVESPGWISFSRFQVVADCNGSHHFVFWVVVFFCIVPASDFVRRLKRSVVNRQIHLSDLTFPLRSPMWDSCKVEMTSSQFHSQTSGCLKCIDVNIGAQMWEQSHKSSKK